MRRANNTSVTLTNDSKAVVIAAGPVTSEVRIEDPKDSKNATVVRVDNKKIK